MLDLVTKGQSASNAAYSGIRLALSILAAEQQHSMISELTYHIELIDLTLFRVIKDESVETQLAAAKALLSLQKQSEMLSKLIFLTLQAAVNAGMAEAQYLQSDLLENGQGCEKDIKQAQALLLKSAKQGYTEAEAKVGISLAKGTRGFSQDTKQAIEWLTNAMRKGHNEAMLELGLLYFNGSHGVTQDEVRGFDRLLAAAQLGNSAAMRTVAKCYKDGKVVPTSKERALHWYQEAHKADPENAECSFELSQFYLEKPAALSENVTEGLNMLRKSVKAGYAPAQSRMAEMVLFEEQQLVRDPKLAFDLFSSAASQGNAVGQAGLGICYLEGTSISFA